MLGWELGTYTEFMTLINSTIPSANAKDVLIWCGSVNGYFTVKNLCAWVDANLQEEVDFMVPNQIRKRLPPKVWLLCWQACHNKLATKLNLWARGVLQAENTRCCFCNLEEENTDHLFLLCSRVNVLWYNIFRKEGLVWASPNSLLTVFEEWPNWISGMDSKIWSVIPYAFVWSVWMERNSVIFRDKGVQMQGVEDMIGMRIAWWIKSVWPHCPFDADQIYRNLSDIRMPSSNAIPRQVLWAPPDIGVIKCNVDGASKGNPGNSGIGGVIRDSNKKWLGYFALGIGFAWAYEAEVKAILHGLLFCQQFLFKNVILESDSTIAIGWVLSRDKRPWKLLNELNQIDYLLHEVNCLEVRHTFREANSEADLLANTGCETNAPVWVLLEERLGTL